MQSSANKTLKRSLHWYLATVWHSAAVLSLRERFKYNIIQENSIYTNWRNDYYLSMILYTYKVYILNINK